MVPQPYITFSNKNTVDSPLYPILCCIYLLFFSFIFFFVVVVVVWLIFVIRQEQPVLSFANSLFFFFFHRFSHCARLTSSFRICLFNGNTNCYQMSVDIRMVLFTVYLVHPRWLSYSTTWLFSVAATLSPAATWISLFPGIPQLVL